MPLRFWTRPPLSFSCCHLHWHTSLQQQNNRYKVLNCAVKESSRNIDYQNRSYYCCCCCSYFCWFCCCCASVVVVIARFVALTADTKRQLVLLTRPRIKSRANTSSGIEYISQSKLRWDLRIFGVAPIHHEESSLRTTTPHGHSKKWMLQLSLKGKLLAPEKYSINIFVLHSSTGVANQSEPKSHIFYCVTAKSHITHMGTHEHHLITSSHTHTDLCLARFIVNVTHQHDNDRIWLLQSRMKPGKEQHAAREPRVGHPCSSISHGPILRLFSVQLQTSALTSSLPCK